MCWTDLGYGLFALGGTGMIIIAWKLFERKKPEQKSNANPSNDHESHSVSSE